MKIHEYQAKELLSGCGIVIPEGVMVSDLAAGLEASKRIVFPLVVKANIGGSGAGIMRYESMDQLRASIVDKFLPTSVDGVLLVQDYVPARGGTITRIETLDRAAEAGVSIDLIVRGMCCLRPGVPVIAAGRTDPCF